MREPYDPGALLDAFALAADAVFAVDDRLRVVFWNAAAERVFGLTAADAIGRRCDEIVAGFESSGAPLCGPDCRVVGCARRGHAPESYDLRRTGANGDTQWLNVSIVVLKGRRRSSTLSVHLARDVTAARRVERQAGDILQALRGDARPAPISGITAREADVLRLLACGATNAAIASALGISPTTVRNHIEHLLAKLGVHSKLEAVVVAARSGFL